jgi:hypothetical protein
MRPGRPIRSERDTGIGALARLVSLGDPGVVDSPCEAFGEYGHAAPCHSVGFIMPCARRRWRETGSKVAS